MPFDPFFSSKVSGETYSHRKEAWAKAQQARRIIQKNRPKYRQKVLETISHTPSESWLMIGPSNRKHRHRLQVSGGPAQTGFKPPRKKWDEK
jgi:hypothetical protein